MTDEKRLQTTIEAETEAASDAVTSELAGLRAAAVSDPEIPEAVRGFLSGGAQLDALRLTALGRWTYNGRPVEHPRVIALFSRSLSRTTSGTWVLRIPPYTYPVLVDGAGQFIDKVRVGAAPEGAAGSSDPSGKTSHNGSVDPSGDLPRRRSSASGAALVDGVSKASWGRTLGGVWVRLDFATLETDGDAYLGVRVGGAAARLIGPAYAAVSAGLDADDAGWLVRWDGATYRVNDREGPAVSGGIS